MKTTIEFDPALFRRLKVEAARQGRTIRELVDEGVRHVIARPGAAAAAAHEQPEWFGTLSSYAANAGGRHGLAAIRRSVARTRST
jgi:hypothetical protein